MNSQQAKKILALYRPQSVDALDPEVAEALEQVKRDPELQGWFEQHCAFQTALRAKFKQITVPEGLKERILTRDSTAIFKIGWRGPHWLAAAAAIALIVGIAGFWLQRDDGRGFPAFRERMARTALREYRMDVLTKDLTEIRQFLTRNDGRGDYVLTQGLEKLPGEGCAILSWRGQRVSLICFDGGNGTDLFLFIIHRSALAGAPRTDVPEFARVNKLMTASWSVSDKTYVLAGAGAEAFLRKFL